MSPKTYFVKTFGCQMNYADSEKIHMILMGSGFRKVLDPVRADIIIMNTCSVRQKGEDKVFGFMHEIERYHKKQKEGKQQTTISNQNGMDNDKKLQSDNYELGTASFPLFGITGCMVRKTGMAKRYLKNFSLDIPSETEESAPNNRADPSHAQDDKKRYKRSEAKKITLLSDGNSLVNYDDELFLRSDSIDFIFRIEEVSYITKILSLIDGKDIGNDAKFNEYLAVKQLQENPSSANVIIQTGCDNYCTYCIVPYTRGREMSRPQEAIVFEIGEVVSKGAKEVTLLGQNVNSYGKETRTKLWNEEEMRWIAPLLRGDVTKGQGGFLPESSLTSNKHIPYRIDLSEKARELRKNQTPFEKIFWYEILQQDVFGKYKFTRQKPLGDYIVDFYSSELGLVIELDGEQHAENIRYDEQRTKVLNEYGIRVVRYPNHEVLKNKSGVYEDLTRVIREQEQNPPGSPLNRGVTTPFRELLESINAIEGLDRIRFTSSNPHDMTRDILDAHFELPKMCNYLHFALQSGSDTMLKRMNRRHTYADFKAQLDYLRSRDPLFSISTDIIVGFPGETEEEFQATVHAMRECEFDFAYIARYSPRSGTLAGDRYEDDIPPELKAERWNVLNNILRDSVQSRAKYMLGREEEVLISGKGKDDVWLGRTRNFKEVHISPGHQVKMGDIIKVRIVKIGGWTLDGEII